MLLLHIIEYEIAWMDDMFAELAESLRSPTMPSERLLKLFPLPAIPANTITTFAGVALADVESHHTHS